MRLLSRRIYRAFPELDPYSDEQCIRFVHAARKSTTHHFAIGISPLVAGTPIMISGVIASIMLYNSLAGISPSLLDAGPGLLLLWILATIPLLSSGPAVGLWTRDILLRRRINQVLRKSGQCPGCVYSLIGLAVSPDSTVRCPECGLEVEVDPSLAELANIAADTPAAYGTTGRFRRKADADFEVQRWWTARKRRWTRRIAIALGAMALATAIAYGGYQLVSGWSRRAQADQALAARPELAARLLGLLPPPPTNASQSENGWAIVRDVHGLLEAVNTTLSQAPDHVPGQWVDPWSVIWRLDSQSTGPNEDPATVAKERAIAEQIMHAYAAAGLREQLDRIIAAKAGWLSPLPTDSVESMLAEFTDLAAKQRNVSNAIWVLGEQAKAKTDHETFLKTIEAHLALSHLGTGTPISSVMNISHSARSGALRRVRALLEGGADQRSLDRLAAMLDRHPFEVRLKPLFEGGRLESLDAIAVRFSSPEQSRSYTMRNWRLAPFIASPGEWNGTYRQNIAGVNKLFDLAALQLDKPERIDSQWILSQPVGDLQMPLTVFMVTSGDVPIREMVTAEEAATRTMIALERFRLAHGTYPHELAQLVPSFLAATPFDSWMRTPLLYKKLKSPGAGDPFPYLLYSTMPDMTTSIRSYQPKSGWGGWFGTDGPPAENDK